MKKKKRNTLLFIILVLFMMSFAGSQSYVTDHERINKGKDIFVYNLFDYKNLKLIPCSFSYTTKMKDALEFIVNGSTGEEYLLLENGYFANFYFSEEKPLCVVTMATKSRVSGYFYNNIRNADYKATSFLCEEKKYYGAENLGTCVLSKPWVEGVAGSGIGERIELTWQTWDGGPVDGGGIGAIILSNGYVSYRNPSLYSKNNRVRELKVFSVEGNYSFIVMLEDTPNPQVIFLPCVVATMTLEIVSVYKGTKWDDTCLNYLKGLEMRQSRWLYEEMHSKGEKIIGCVGK